MTTTIDTTNRAAELDRLAGIMQTASDRIADELREFFEGEPAIHPDPIVGCRIVKAWRAPAWLEALAESVRAPTTEAAPDAPTDTSAKPQRFDQWLTDEWEATGLPSPTRAHLCVADQSALAAYSLFGDLAAELQSALTSEVGLDGLCHRKVDGALRAIDCLLLGAIDRLEGARHVTRKLANEVTP